MEFTPKKREWVKNAAIVFLSVLLVLTFFSNTWMNRSLPEVATQYVTNGSITAKVRGTGTVTAVGVTSVKADQTREIRAVMVKVGQEVKVGDVLFVLGQGEASELEAAQEQLRQLELSYQRTAVGISYPNYSGDERRIKAAKNEMNRAKNKLDEILELIANKDSAETLSNLTEKLEEAEKIRDAEREAYDQLVSAAQDDLKAKAQERDDAQRALALNGIRFVEKNNRSEWKFLDSNNETVILNDSGSVVNTAVSTLSTGVKVYPVYRYELSTLSLFSAESGEDAANDADPSEDQTAQPADEGNTGEQPQTPAEPVETEPPASTTPPESTTPPAAYEPKPEDLALMRDFQKKQQSVDAAQSYLENIPRTNLDAAQAKVDGLQKAINDILIASKDSEEYIKAKEAYDTARETYLSLKEALNEKKAADARTQSLAYLDLADINAQIEAAKKKVTELAGGEENQILAKTAGTIETVDCVPGDTKLKGDLLCTIQVPDLGYTMSFSVSNEQARRLKPGDSATVSNYYWGNQIVATLESIKADPKNPQTNKLLTFDVTGDVNPGAEITVSVGQKSANYDIIVPNSAIRSDTNGSFVLAIESKNSPLGNRYIARRVEVKVLAEDDVNSAVTADLGFGDYVITTSNAPVKNGDMVRLADNG